MTRETLQRSITTIFLIEMRLEVTIKLAWTFGPSKLKSAAPIPTALLIDERTFPPRSFCRWNFKTLDTSRFASTGHPFLTAAQGLEACRNTSSFYATLSNWVGVWW